MIDVRVRDEDVRELENLGGRKAIEAAEIEQHGRALPAQADVQAGVAERPVDQAWQERGFHAALMSGTSRAPER